jgi:hypothetical protein
VFGGGLLAGIGFTGLQVIAALTLFRIYQVLRYSDALDARPPNTLGKFLRYAGMVAMTAGALSGVGLFLVEPLTLAIFKTAGDGGIGYFVVRLGLVLTANFGWLGCLVFELSRVCGEMLSAARVVVSQQRRRQDVAILVVIILAAIGAPHLIRQTVGQPCGEGNLASCVSTTEASVRRIVALPSGEPVELESGVEEIQLRRGSDSERPLLSESPEISLRIAGHPVATSSGARVRVLLDAKPAPQEGVIFTMLVFDGVEETARFITHFGKGAVIEKTTSGRARLVVGMPGNANTGMRPAQQGANGRVYSPDQIFINFRSAVGTEVEAREWPLRILRPALSAGIEAGGRTNSSKDRFANGNIDSVCNGRIIAKPTDAITFVGDLGSPLWGATFAESETAGPHALLSSRDRVVCQDGAVWIVSYAVRRPEMQIRRYSRDGHLERYVETTIPPAKLGSLEFDGIDMSSMREEAGKIYFARIISVIENGSVVERKRELFEIALEI